MNNRLSWNEYFLKMAEMTALRSACLSNKKGCVLVKDNRVLGTGYNGPPSGLPHCEYRDDNGKYFKQEFKPAGSSSLFVKLYPELNYECPRKRMGFSSAKGLEHCVAVHAEVNAILTARTDTRGSKLYCSFPNMPCRECSKIIINAGVTEVILNGVPINYPEIGIRGVELLLKGNVRIIDGAKEGSNT